MVVIFAWPTSPTGNEQERVATPSTWTVQAPHCATPQPYFVPVRPIHSRITQRRGVSGSASTCCVWPLIERVIIALFPPLRGPADHAPPAGVPSFFHASMTAVVPCRQAGDCRT